MSAAASINKLLYDRLEHFGSDTCLKIHDILEPGIPICAVKANLIVLELTWRREGDQVGRSRSLGPPAAHDNLRPVGKKGLELSLSFVGGLGRHE